MTVPVEAAPPIRLVGLSVNDDRAGLLIVREALMESPKVAVI